MIAFPQQSPLPAAPERSEQPTLDSGAVADTLGPAGEIAAALQQYEHRPTQIEMARSIVQLYNDGGIGLLEAGTGVGKSLGYLVPAIRWAQAGGERTVVSTNTINLQEQLVRKDLPFLAEALAGTGTVRFALLKGWRNYLCLLRLEQARLFGGELLTGGAELETVARWAESTEDGSLAELREPPSPELWDEVAAEPDLCTRTACPHFERCFLFRARREAAQAHVVVVNHHLLMSDLAVRRASGNWEEAAVIPQYTRLVVDEGHHLEDAAAAHLGASASVAGLKRLLARLAKPAAGPRRESRGLLFALEARLRERNDLFSRASLDLLAARVVPAINACRRHGETVFELLRVVLRDSGQQVLRLTDDFATHPVWRAGLGAALSDMISETAVLSDALRLIRDRLQAEETRDDRTATLIEEIAGVSRRLEAISDALYGALESEPESHERVRWIETRGRGDNIAVNWVPLNLAPILRDDLFGRLTTAVVTSATLSAGGNFSFLAGRLGLDQRDPEAVAVSYDSPFDFARQALFAVPSDVPAPNSDPAGHLAAVVRMISDLAAASDGGIFALFTSHRDVREAALRLRSARESELRPLLVHGEQSRDSLLEEFRRSGRAILLGTSSYWEGVDVPGSALRGLVIARLPFRVPTEPLTAAHCEAILARGGDPFAEYMVPHAALRLKQGFGRLIRTATDRGVVVLADPRAASRSYGPELLAALPPARRLFLPWAEIAKQLRSFYQVSDPCP